MADLLAQLIAFYEEDPTDPFNIYGLALEYSKTDKQKAVFYFNELLEKHSDYIPTYYHAAHLFDELGQIEKANWVYLEGIKIAKALNKQHALMELTRAYDSFLIENDLD